MDYRHTEAFARAMEAAELRAHRLRREAMTDFWGDVARWVRALWRGAFAGS